MITKDRSGAYAAQKVGPGERPSRRQDEPQGVITAPLSAPRGGCAEALQLMAKVTLLLSVGAFALTAVVGGTGFFATLSNHISLAVSLRPVLMTSEVVTVGIFLLALGLRLGALFASRGSPGQQWHIQTRG